jgi:hypothetical protein
MLFGPSPVPALTRAFKHQGNAWIEYYYDPDVGDWVPGEPVVATGEAMWVVPPCPGVFYPPSHVPPSVVAVGPDLFVDLQASYPSPLGTPCCGQDMTYTIVYGNLNSAALHNAKIILNLDSVLATYPTPSSSPPTYTAPGVNWVGRGGNTLNWKIPLLAGYASGTLTIKVKVAGCVAPTVVGVASSVTFEKNPPTFATANHFAQTTCSFDPNDKTVNPRGCGPEGLIPADTDLSYVVQFQNLGTGPANQVVIRDTLDPHLDLGSFQMIAGSHPFSLMVSGRELAWTFAGINLPAASADEAGSHGYVKFTVKQNPGLPVGTLITNRAMIYFDLNPPVLTRTTTNTITANAVPLAAFNVSQRTPLVGANVNFTYTGGTPGASFAWDFGSGAVPATSTAQNPTGVSYSTAGPKLPVLKVTLGGCEAEPALNLINVGSLLPPLGIARNGTNAILSWDDEAYQLQATPSFGSSVTWTNVPEASPVAVPITGSLFFRLIKL